MEIKITEKGRGTGNISVAESAKTMKIGEQWVMTATNIKALANARTACSRLGIGTGRFYSVTSTEDNHIIIERIK